MSIFTCGLSVAGAAPSNPEAVVRLKDGSVIKGQILGREADGYRVMTNALGIVKVRDADVAGIDEAQGKGIEQYEKVITQNPENMMAIESLARDESIVEILSDPKIQEAVARKDFLYLERDEKFQRLMNHPAIKKIIYNTKGAVKSGTP